MSDDTAAQQLERKQRLKTAMSTLAMELELKEGKPFSINKGVEESVKVLQYAALSREPTVINSLYKVVMLMTAAQLQFFRSKGIVLDLHELDKKMAMQKHQGRQEVLYRGQSVAAKAEGGEDMSVQSKKKIMYRGREQLT